MEYSLAQTKKDFEFIASLFNSQNNAFLIKKNITGQEVMQKHKNNKLIKTFILKNSKNQMMGWFTITKFKKLNNEASIGMIIDYPYQNKGYGQKTINLIELESKKMGINKLILEVFTDNQRAIHIYRKSGFENENKKNNDLILKMSKYL